MMQVRARTQCRIGKSVYAGEADVPGVFTRETESLLSTLKWDKTRNSTSARRRRVCFESKGNSLFRRMQYVTIVKYCLHKINILYTFLIFNSVCKFSCNFRHLCLKLKIAGCGLMMSNDVISCKLVPNCSNNISLL